MEEMRVALLTRFKEMKIELRKEVNAWVAEAIKKEIAKEQEQGAGEPEASLAAKEPREKKVVVDAKETPMPTSEVTSNPPPKDGGGNTKRKNQ
tara:strand:+ start:235 stop:513 length:279 start_codon:yes stop_codon:yes gene_type:complete